MNNSCSSHGIFSEFWKRAIITPIPKVKMPLEYKDLRPVSVLPHLSKVLEKIMVTQLLQYTARFSLIPPTQFGFRRSSSYEKALLQVTDSIFNL